MKEENKTEKEVFANSNGKCMIVKEDMICPINGFHCDDECCTVGSICNLSGSNNLLGELSPD